MQRQPLVDAVTNVKQATVLITLGLPLNKPGVFILFDKDHPGTTGGVAHFLFESNVANAVRQYLRTYEADKADGELDTFLDSHKGKSPELDDFIRQLEPVIRDALIVYGRRFLENYQTVLRSLKTEVAAYVKTGGTPVYDQHGELAGIQEFTLKGVRRNQNGEIIGTQDFTLKGVPRK